MSVVFFANGFVLLFSAAMMALDAVLFRGTSGVFFEASVLAATIGACLCLAAQRPRPTIEHRHTFVLTASVWLTAAFAGSLPLELWSLDFTDAVFESMSGITTTGSTVITGLDTTPPGVLMWRAVLQWVGGVGFIVTGIALLPVLRVGGMQLFHSESSDRETELGGAARMAAGTLQVYSGLSLACVLVYLAGGMTPFDAVAHAMATISTGGFSTHDASFSYFDSVFLDASCTVFMFLGALPFAWYIRLTLLRRNPSEQVQALAIGLLCVIAVLTLWRILDGGDPWMALRQVTFNVVSVVTTTGFATADYTLWGTPAVAAFFFLTFLGGCTGSTAGGGKVMRWLIMIRAIINQTQKVHQPHTVLPLRYEGRTIERDVVDGVMAFLVLYGLTFWGIAVLLTLCGLDLETALSGSITALANVGPGVGPTIGPAGNFSTLPDVAKWILTFGMYLGRLELLTVFVLFKPSLWREIA